MHETTDFFELADQIARDIDDVRVDVAVRARATDALLQTPDERKLWINDPVLGIAGVVMINFAKCSLVDHFFRLGDGGNPTVVVADHVNDFGLFCGGKHFLALRDIQGERFFAENMFPGFGGGDGDFRVRIVGRVDVHDIDVRRVDDGSPIGGGMSPTELCACVLDSLGVAAANGVEFDFGFERKKVGRLAPGVGMGLSHEAVADHSNA